MKMYKDLLNAMFNFVVKEDLPVPLYSLLIQFTNNSISIFADVMSTTKYYF